MLCMFKVEEEKTKEKVAPSEFWAKGQQEKSSPSNLRYASGTRLSSWRKGSQVLGISLSHATVWNAALFLKQTRVSSHMGRSFHLFAEMPLKVLDVF